MSVKMQFPRVIRAHTMPLNIDQIASVAPAVFTETAGNTTIDGHYSYISTEVVLKALLSLDYVVTEAAQQRSPREQSQDLYGKHMLRLRQASMFAKEKKVGDVVPEIVLVNAHNASSKLHLYGGLWRFICANGLMVGDTIDSISFGHRKVVMGDVLTAVEKMGNVIMPTVLQHMAAMKAKKLTPKEQTVYAARALALRWEEGTEAVAAEDLLRARREQDAANDVWSVYNRVQENVIVGGFTARNRNRNILRLEQVTQVVNINRALWDMAVRLAA